MRIRALNPLVLVYFFGGPLPVTSLWNIKFLFENCNGIVTDQ